MHDSLCSVMKRFKTVLKELYLFCWWTFELYFLFLSPFPFFFLFSQAFKYSFSKHSHLNVKWIHCCIGPSLFWMLLCVNVRVAYCSGWQKRPPWHIPVASLHLSHDLTNYMKMGTITKMCHWTRFELVFIYLPFL